eukprot:scaffold71843_cov60-Phaeocystis_antarctica.AAC.2
MARDGGAARPPPPPPPPLDPVLCPPVEQCPPVLCPPVLCPPVEQLPPTAQCGGRAGCGGVASSAPEPRCGGCGVPRPLALGVCGRESRPTSRSP